MMSSNVESGQGRRRGRIEEAPTRHLQVGGIDPWDANVNELMEEFLPAVSICYYEERNFGPELEFCLEAIRRPEDYVEFLSALDVSPRVLTLQEMEDEDAGCDFEYTVGFNRISGQLTRCLPDDSTLYADTIRLQFTLRKNREWEFAVQNYRDCGPDATPLTEEELANLARLPRLVVPVEGAYAYSLDDVRRIVEGLPATQQVAFDCERCRWFVLMAGEPVEDEEHPTARYRCSCGCLYDADQQVVRSTVVLREGELPK